jgi:uncharacterized membrane protein
MESRAKLLGHPVHPMLIVLPLGLFISAVVFDAVYLWRGSPTFATVAYWNIAGGIIGGLLAAVCDPVGHSREAHRSSARRRKRRRGGRIHVGVLDAKQCDRCRADDWRLPD